MLLTLGFGLGIGILSPLNDGMYSAISLFLFPLVFALLAVSLGLDFKPQPVAEYQVKARTPSSARPSHAPFVTSHSVN